MRAGKPSRMARGAAAYRAVHQRVDGGVIFRDPYAVRILDADTLLTLDQMAADPSLRPMRLFIAARSRFSEDALGASVARGVRQVVVLGAGLDTFSLRNPYEGQGVRVFEVDFPATQAWKREQLARASLAVPSSLTFAPVDFERQSLSHGLAQAGFRADRPAFFQWLGVVPYLTREAISQTLDFVAGIPRRKSYSTTLNPLKITPPIAAPTSWALPRARRRGASHGSACLTRRYCPTCCARRVLRRSKISASPNSAIATTAR